MAKISGLPDELLVKILSFLPTKVSVSTSVLSKQWQFLWMWLPNLEYNASRDITDISLLDQSSRLSYYRDFISKNLPLHRAPIIESLHLRFLCRSFLQPDDFKSWVEIALSRYVRELSVGLALSTGSLPSSLYTCNSLLTLKLKGHTLFVDVPRNVSLPCLKTLQLECVTYSNKDSLQLLLSHCPVLEDLSIERHDLDNVRALVVTVPSLLRLSIETISTFYSDHVYKIDTPSLKYFKFKDNCKVFSYVTEHMPTLEEADIYVKQILHKLLESVTSVKRLSLFINSGEGITLYRGGIHFKQLENLKIFVYYNDWSKLLVQLLKDSPKLQILSLHVNKFSRFGECEPVSWNNNNESSVPRCLLKSLENFELVGYNGSLEDIDFLSFILENATHLKFYSVVP